MPLFVLTPRMLKALQDLYSRSETIDWAAYEQFKHEILSTIPKEDHHGRTDHLVGPQRSSDYH